MKIAIFGGSFDPPHIGHEAIVNVALKELDIDKLVIVPTFLNPFKKHSFLNAYDRLFLVQKLFKNNSIIDVSDYEIKQNKSVYSIQTVKYLKQLYKATQIYFIIGADNLEKLHLWHQFDELNSLVTFVVANRNGFLNTNYDNIRTLNVSMDTSSTNLRESLDLNYIPQTIKTDVKNIWQKKQRQKNFEK